MMSLAVVVLLVDLLESTSIARALARCGARAQFKLSSVLLLFACSVCCQMTCTGQMAEWSLYCESARFPHSPSARQQQASR